MPLKEARRRRFVAAGAIAILFTAWGESASAQTQPREITLRDAIRLAVERDPAAIAAEVAQSNARSDALQATGSWLPSLNATSSYNNSSNQRFDQATGQLVSESYSSALQVGYDLFTGGRRLINRRTTGAALLAADAQWEAQRFATIQAVTEAYYTAAAAVGIVSAAEQRLERAREQMTFANTRMELGTSTRSDVLRAEIELGNAEASLLEAQAAHRTALLELGRRVGEPGPLAPADRTLEIAAPALPSLDVLIDRATATSPSVAAANATLRSRRAERMAAWTPYLPTVRLTGGYDWFAYQWPADQRSWSMRVTASLPIFNGFQREASLQRANAQERLAEARARDAVNAARVAVESAVAQIETASRRAEIADRAVLLAEEDLRVQEERYNIGASTIIDLQTSQVAMTDAQVNAVRARQALATAIARLEAILGQSLSGDS